MGRDGATTAPVPQRGVAYLGLENPRPTRNFKGFMSADTRIVYLEYIITVTQEAGRFTSRVTREGALIEHDGHLSEGWKAASCASLDRAIQVAKTAIDNDHIR